MVFNATFNNISVIEFLIYQEIHRNRQSFDLIFLCFNATFSNISAISWWPVLVVEEAGVPGENHQPTMGKQLVNFITCDCESSAPFFVIYKAGCEPMPYWW